MNLQNLQDPGSNASKCSALWFGFHTFKAHCEFTNDMSETHKNVWHDLPWFSHYFFPDGNIETVNYRKNHETPIFGGQNLHVSRFDFPVSLCQATLRNPHILFLVQLVDGRDPLEIPRPIHGIQKTSAVVRWSTIMALLAHGCSDARWSLLRKPMHFGGVHGHRGTPIHGWFIRVINHL